MSSSLVSVTPERFNLVCKVSDEYTLQIGSGSSDQRVVYKLYTTDHKTFTVRPKQGVLNPLEKHQIVVALRSGAPTPATATTYNFMVCYRVLVRGEVVDPNGSNIGDLLKSGNRETTYFNCTVHPSGAPASASPDHNVSPSAPISNASTAAPSAAKVLDDDQSGSLLSKPAPPPVEEEKSATSTTPPNFAAPKSAAAPPTTTRSSAAAATSNTFALEKQIAEKKSRIEDAEAQIRKLEKQTAALRAQQKKDDEEIVAAQRLLGGKLNVGADGTMSLVPLNASSGSGFSALYAVVAVAVAFLFGLAV